MNDSEFIAWIRDRLHHVHGENINADFMHRLKKISDEIKELPLPKYAWSLSELRRMAAGEFIDRNGKRYAMCHNCRTIIRIDKPWIGSLHICS